MPGGQERTAQPPGLLQQSAEFNRAVAHHAGVGGPARLVLRRKGVHHTLGKGLRQVQGVVGDPQLGGHRPGILHILKGMAGRSPAGSQILRPEQTQRDPGRFIARLPEQPGGGGAVHSSAHGHSNGIVQRGSPFPGRAGHD